MSGALPPRVVSQRAIDAPQQSAPSGRMTRSEELRTMDRVEYKVVENRLRRMAGRQSLQLVTSRRRDHRHLNQGKYMLLDPHTTAIVTGGDWSLDLADVEQVLLTAGPEVRTEQARKCPSCATPTYSLSGLVKGALVDERECPECGHSFIAESGPGLDLPHDYLLETAQASR